MLKNSLDSVPNGKQTFYKIHHTDFAGIVEDADLVIMHEWYEPELISHIEKLKASHDDQLLFHDTYRRSVTAPGQMENKIDNWSDNECTEELQEYLIKPVKVLGL